MLVSDLRLVWSIQYRFVGVLSCVSPRWDVPLFGDVSSASVISCKFHWTLSSEEGIVMCVGCEFKDDVILGVSFFLTVILQI